MNMRAMPYCSVVAARNPVQKLNCTAPRMTMNSPTKPLVAGRPAFAIANSIRNARGCPAISPHSVIGLFALRHDLITVARCLST